MRKRMIAAAAATLALTQPSIVYAKQDCVAAADLSAGVVYAMPIAYDAMTSVCEKQLKTTGFLAKNGDQFIAPFRAQQGKSWPGALRLIKTFMERQTNDQTTGGVDITSLISTLPESSLRPFVDGMIGQMIAGKIKPKNCKDIERGMELLSPLPTENVGDLMAFLAKVSDFKNPSICAPRSTNKATK